MSVYLSDLCFVDHAGALAQRNHWEIEVKYLSNKDFLNRLEIFEPSIADDVADWCRFRTP
jgi:hypothetical protein